MIYLAVSGDMVPQCICPSSTDVPEIFETNYNVDDKNAICQPDCFLFKLFEYTTNTKCAGLYMLIVWFWTSQIIVAAGEIAIGENNERLLLKRNEAFAQLCFDYCVSHASISSQERTSSWLSYALSINKSHNQEQQLLDRLSLLSLLSFTLFVLLLSIC